MIITVTLNPAVDRTLWVSSLAPGNTNRVLRSVMDPGGKGINMSLVLRECGTETTALGFIAGHTGQFIKTYLESRGIATSFVEVKGETRINIAVEDPGRRPPTTLHESGPEVGMDGLRALCDRSGPSSSRPSASPSAGASLPECPTTSMPR